MKLECLIPGERVDPAPIPTAEPDEYARFVDPDTGRRSLVARWGCRVVILDEDTQTIRFDDTYQAPTTASAGYANWCYDPTAVRPRQYDAVKIPELGDGIYVVFSVTDDASDWLVRVARHQSNGLPGPTITHRIYPGTFSYVSRRA